MKSRFLLLLLVIACVLQMAAAPTPKPKLVLAVVVDQFRYDYLMRFRADYKAGFERLLEHGAVFTDAHHIHFPTVTAIGHSTVLSGATPSISGIVGNEWYDRETGKSVTSVSDPTERLLGGQPGKPGSSPRRLLVSTLGDEMKMDGKSTKSIGISIKDRSAILPVGHTANAAYWFDGATGNWVSSSYYFDDLPGWVKDVNQGRPGDKYLGAEWLPLVSSEGSSKPFEKLSNTPDAGFYNSLEATPYGNELIETMAERCIVAEQLGQHPGTDLLTVSFSSNDYVGHAMGPDAPEVKDISIRTDRILGKLLDFIDDKVGRNDYIIVLTADHGVAPVPEVNRARKMPGGRIPARLIGEAVQSSLTGKYGEGKWIVGSSGPTPYLNYPLIHEKHLDEAEVERVAAQSLRDIPHVFRVYTREQLLTGQVLEDYVSRAVRNGFYRQRSGDLFIIPEAYWFFDDHPDSSHGTTHGTPFNYDTHVPVIFMGPGIKPGRYDQPVAVNDIAPTLATMLDVEEPSGSVGRVLTEMLH